MFSNRTSRREFLAGGTAAVALSAVSFSATASQVPRSFPIPGKQSHRIAAHGGRLAVSVDRELLELSHTGELLSRRELPRPARALTFDGSGGLLIAMKNEIARLDGVSGKLSSVARLENESVVTSLAASQDADGSHILHVCDAAMQMVWIVDRDGSRKAHSNWDQFRFPQDFFQLAVGADRDVYVSNPARHRIERLDAAGTSISRIGGKSRDLSGFSGCCNPVSFVLRGDGSLITAEQGTSRVKLFNREGKFVRVLTEPETFTVVEEDPKRDKVCVAKGLDLALLTETKVAVLDRAANRVVLCEG